MKWRILMFLCFFCLLFLWEPVSAASFGMSASTKTVSPKKTFTVRVGGNCIGRVNLSVTNGTLSTSSVWVEEGYVTVKVTAGTSGKVTVTAKPAAGFSDADANLYNPGSRTVSVTISSNSSTPTTPSTPQSSDNTLSSITVSSGTLSPSFHKDKTEYSLDLPASTNKISVKATTSNSKAQVKGTGSIEVKPGTNRIELVVTAENGSKKTYVIKAYVDETPQVYLNYKNEKIGILRSKEGISLPKDFVASEYTIEGKTIPMFTKEKIILIYGINEAKTRNFYIFDQSKNQLISKFFPITIYGRNFYFTDTEIKKENVFLDKITINETEIACYKFGKDHENYCLLSAIREDGTSLEYLYESTEGTVQLYPEFMMINQATKTESSPILIVILSSLLLLTTSTTIFLWIRRKRVV